MRTRPTAAAAAVAVAVAVATLGCAPDLEISWDGSSCPDDQEQCIDGGECEVLELSRGDVTEYLLDCNSGLSSLQVEGAPDLARVGDRVTIYELRINSPGIDARSIRVMDASGGLLVARAHYVSPLEVDLKHMATVVGMGVVPLALDIEQVRGRFVVTIETDADSVTLRPGRTASLADSGAEWEVSSAKVGDLSGVRLGVVRIAD
jgi:hypothetical protein